MENEKNQSSYEAKVSNSKYGKCLSNQNDKYVKQNSTYCFKSCGIVRKLLRKELFGLWVVETINMYVDPQVLVNDTPTKLKDLIN